MLPPRPSLATEPSEGPGPTSLPGIVRAPRERVQGSGSLCPHEGAAGGPSGTNGETEATWGSPSFWVTQRVRVSSTARGVGESRPDPARLLAGPPSREPEPSGQGAWRSPARRPWGRGHSSPAPAHWLRRQGRGEAARCWGSAGGGGSEERRRWAEARAPLARAPHGRSRWSSQGTRRAWRRLRRGMHSARLDSFLGQLRGELVRLGCGVTLGDACGVRGSSARTTVGWGAAPSAGPKRDGGGAARGAQMARVGFRTVGSCAGHQVTAAQLAVLRAAEGAGEVGTDASFGIELGLEGPRGAGGAVDAPSQVCLHLLPLPRPGSALWALGG